MESKQKKLVFSADSGKPSDKSGRKHELVFTNDQQGDNNMKSNFEFLNSDFPVLSNFGKLAENYLYSDSNSCLMKLGMIGETIVNLCFTYDKIPFPYDNTAVNRIVSLYR